MLKWKKGKKSEVPKSNRKLKIKANDELQTKLILDADGDTNMDHHPELDQEDDEVEDEETVEPEEIQAKSEVEDDDEEGVFTQNSSVEMLLPSLRRKSQGQKSLEAQPEDPEYVVDV